MLPDFLEAQKKKLIVTSAVLIALLIAFLAGRGTAPNQTEVQIQEKIVEKIVEVEKKSKDTQTHKETKTVKNADGSETTVVVEDIKSKEESENSKKTDIEKKTETIVSSGQDKQYRLGVYAESSFSYRAFEEKPTYGVNAGRRLFGPFWMDAQYNIKNNAFGLGLSIEF